MYSTSVSPFFHAKNPGSQGIGDDRMCIITHSLRPILYTQQSHSTKPLPPVKWLRILPEKTHDWSLSRVGRIQTSLVIQQKNLPANARDTGSIPAPGRFPHASKQQSLWARSLGLVSCYKRSQRNEKPMHCIKSSRRSLQLEKARA